MYLSFAFNFSVTACIRRQAGFCCIQYQVCAGVINAFSLDQSAAIGLIDTNCILDYVTIPGTVMTGSG